MGMIDTIKVAVVIAPHPDDEVLGCGGTMARMAQAGVQVHVVIMTRGGPPRFTEDQIDRVMAEAECAHGVLNVTRTHFLNFPAAGLDTLPIADVNERLDQLLRSIRPDALFVPFVGDIHFDHQVAFTAAMVFARPRAAGAPTHIYAYETLSETNWYAPGITPAFLPNLYVDIGNHIEQKVEAFECFASQVKPFPDERSIKALRSLAIMRGATVFKHAAEAFMTIRQVE